MRRIYRLSELEKTVYGRCAAEDGALALSWSVSGFEVSFRAENAELHFVHDYSGDPCYVKLVIDNKDERKYAVATGEEVILLENLGEGAHTLRLYRLSEGNVKLKVAAFAISGSECEILPAPKAPELRFEFIGDSITCGYGDIAEAGTNQFATYQEDSTQTYAFLTARKFGADIRVEAISGQGIVKNCCGEVDYRIPEFFNHQLRVGHEPHDFTGWIPHAVFINAGTNDCGGRVPDDEFRAESGKFLDRIREVYPDAHIFWVYGMMGLRYNAVLSSVIAEKSVCDAKLHYVPIRPIYEFPGNVGAVGHPSAEGQKRAAGVLIEAVRAAMNLPFAQE